MTTPITISKQTLDILKNFSSISNGIAFKEGQPLKAHSPQNDLFAIAKVDEKFPTHAIYEMSKLLAVLGTFKDPTLDYGEKMVTIKSGNAKLDYYYAFEGLIKYNEKNPKLIDPVYQFKMSAAQLSQTMTIASQLRHNEMQFKVVDGKCVVRAVTSVNKKVDETNAFSLEIGDAVDVEFDCSVKIDNVAKLLDGDYSVSIYIAGNTGMVQFKHDTIDLQYYVAMQAK